MATNKVWEDTRHVNRTSTEITPLIQCARTTEDTDIRGKILTVVMTKTPCQIETPVEVIKIGVETEVTCVIVLVPNQLTDVVEKEVMLLQKKC